MSRFFAKASLILVTFCLLLSSCKKDSPERIAPTFFFRHNVNGIPLETASMKYTNLAGNLYEVDQLQYFISEIKFLTKDGEVVPITADKAIHYVDLDIPSTLEWHPYDRIPVTDYDSISFVFGIIQSKNRTGLFVNPPERDMFWPDMMGGGYHYMKMNGKWKANGDTIQPYNMHIGIGMNMNATQFYQNFFTVSLPLKVRTNSVQDVFNIDMDVEKWFESPNLWNWNQTGGQIMQNQDAMRRACQNGAHAFNVTYQAID